MSLDFEAIDNVKDAMQRGRKAKFFTKEYIRQFEHTMANIFLSNEEKYETSCGLVDEFSRLEFKSGIPVADEGVIGYFEYYKMPHVLQILNPDTGHAVRLCLNHKEPWVMVTFLSEAVPVCQTDISLEEALYCDMFMTGINQIITLEGLAKIQLHLVYGEDLTDMGAGLVVH